MRLARLSGTPGSAELENLDEAALPGYVRAGLSGMAWRALFWEGDAASAVLINSTLASTELRSSLGSPSQTLEIVGPARARLSWRDFSKDEAQRFEVTGNPFSLRRTTRFVAKFEERWKDYR